MVSGGNRGFLIRQFVRVFAVVVCLSVLLAGFAVPEVSSPLHHMHVSAAGMNVVVTVKNCGVSTGKKSEQHKNHGTCDGCLNCFAFVATGHELAMVSTHSLGFIVRPAQKLANRTIIPPSPPPKSFIRV